MASDSRSSANRRWLWLGIVVLVASSCSVAQAQDATTRAEEIALARRQKHATLWPERENKKEDAKDSAIREYRR